VRGGEGEGKEGVGRGGVGREGEGEGLSPRTKILATALILQNICIIPIETVF